MFLVNSVCLMVVHQDVSSQLVLKFHASLPAAMIPTMFFTNSNFLKCKHLNIFFLSRVVTVIVPYHRNTKVSKSPSYSFLLLSIVTDVLRIFMNLLFLFLILWQKYPIKRTLGNFYLIISHYLHHCRQKLLACFLTAQTT